MKVPQPKKLPSGKWRLQVMVGGERISITESTEQRCKDKALLIKAQGRNGILKPRDPSSMTLREAMDNYILIHSNILSPATITGYREIQRLRFQSVTDSPINNVGSWQAVVNAEAKDVSPKTVKNAWSFAHSALAEAGVPENDIKVKLPKIIKEERPFLDHEQIKAFLEGIKGKECELAALLALHSLRRSEVLDVEKSDIVKGVIHVRGACVRNEHNEFIHKKENKTESSKRDIPIIIPRLSDLAKDAAPGYLVTVHPSSTYRQINRICASLGLPEVGWHGLRHSFASLCYHLNIPALVTKDLGGWKDINTVLKIYTHLADSDKEDAAVALKDFFKFRE